MRPTLLRLFAPCIALLAPTVRATEPLAIRDQNPLTRALYLPTAGPAAMPGKDDSWQLGATLLWTNTANLAATAQERLRVDEESLEVTLSAARQVAGWQLRASLPVVQRSSGLLDGFIDSWHRLFGMPQGVRPGLPRNAYALEYQRLGQATVANAAGTAVGDLAVQAERVLLAGPALTLQGGLGIELPTGSRAALTGNGAVDAAAWVRADAPLAGRWSLSGRAGWSHSGGSTAALPLSRDVAFGGVTVGWQATDAMQALLQVDAHGPTLQATHLPLLREAVLLTVGGRWQLSARKAVEFGVVEDIQVNHSPDVGFHFGWRWAQ